MTSLAVNNAASLLGIPFSGPPLDVRMSKTFVIYILQYIYIYIYVIYCKGSARVPPTPFHLNRPASCRGAFEGGPKCLTSPSEAHKKRGGRLRTGHREAATGLPAAEERLKAVQNA